MSEPTLCYIDGNWAYFKTESDEVPPGWDFVPYDWVGPPRGYIRLQFCVEMERPNDPFPDGCCPYSVDQVNAGEVPWLRLGNDVGIMGGCPISEFVCAIYDYEGAVAVIHGMGGPSIKLLKNQKWEEYREKIASGDK